MPLETVRLTSSFKLNGSIPESLFQEYKQLVKELLGHAHDEGISSFGRLKSEKYHGLRAEHPNLPSHYIYTACQMACSIYRSFRKLKRRGRARSEKPFFKGDAIMLDDHLFSIDLERLEASIATERGRVRFGILHGTYHEKFRGMKVGQAWLVKRDDGHYLKVVFSKVIKSMEPNGKALAVDVNENNITFGTEAKITRLETKEGAIRTAYFLKRRRLQSKPRLNEKPLMVKYRGRESRRVGALYHKIANGLIGEAEKQGCSTIVLENLKGIRRRRKGSKKINGRLNRWGFRKFQAIVEYKAKLAGLNVVYVKAEGTSSLCPRCRVELSPSGYRHMMCPACGLEEDRDVIAIRNLLHSIRQMDVPASSVHGEGPPMTRGGKA